MTAEEFKAALKQLGWSQGELARRFEMSRNGVGFWARGERPVPGYTKEYLRVSLLLNKINVGA